MTLATSRALLTLLAGGGLCGAVSAQVPAGIDPSRIPSGVDLSRLPAGVDISRLPAGVNLPSLPSGGSFPSIPSGMSVPQLPDGMSLPAGIDPSQFPAGVGVPGGYGTPTLPGAGIPAQGVAIQGGGGGADTGVTGGGSTAARPRNRPEFSAGIDFQQIMERQFQGDGDDVTYSEVSGNVGVQVKNRRIVASGSYRASYRIAEQGDAGKSFNQDGVMRAQAILIQEWLTVDTGVIVTRSRVDPGGAAPQTNSAGAKNLTQTYSTFIQPNFTRHFGELGFNATYRYSFTKNEGTLASLGVTGPQVNRFDDSIGHQATASLGMKQSELPFDWTASIEYARENASSLAKHTRSLNASAEITVPVTRSVALVSSGGYERIRISERPALLDPITLLPVTDDNGRFIPDPAQPRELTYEISGFIADAGVIWRPSRRTRFELRAGYRYDDLTVTGLVEWKFSDRTGMTFILSDRIESFGQSVAGGLAAAPVELDLNSSNDADSSFQNCLFGKGAAPAAASAARWARHRRATIASGREASSSRTGCGDGTFRAAPAIRGAPISIRRERLSRSPVSSIKPSSEICR